MLAELQNQRVRRRSENRAESNFEAQPDEIMRPRFSLIVNGKTKGVWEKTGQAIHSVKKLFTFTIPDLAGIKTILKKNLRAILIIAGALALVSATAIVVQLFQREPLPEQHATVPGASPTDSSGTDANPLSAGSQRTMSAYGVRLSSYTVKRGDTLDNIASRNNVNLSTLISYNGIKDSRAITAGTVLQIPNKPGLRYRVVKGDTLSAIAGRFKVPVDDLLDWNNLQSAGVRTGQELFIPNARLSSEDVNRVMGRQYAWPAQGTVSSPYGMRLSPITGTWQFHNGIDIHNIVGTPVTAARAGRVAITDYNPTYGNFIIIVHDDGVQTLYGHLDRISVTRNQRVEQRQKIGTMGNTGASTGPHLHFSIFLRQDQHVDPMKYLPR